jgi:hypothetical protein
VCILLILSDGIEGIARRSRLNASFNSLILQFFTQKHLFYCLSSLSFPAICHISFQFQQFSFINSLFLASIPIFSLNFHGIAFLLFLHHCLFICLLKGLKFIKIYSGIFGLPEMRHYIFVGMAHFGGEFGEWPTMNLAYAQFGRGQKMKCIQFDYSRILDVFDDVKPFKN